MWGCLRCAVGMPARGGKVAHGCAGHTGVCGHSRCGTWLFCRRISKECRKISEKCRGFFEKHGGISKNCRGISEKCRAFRRFCWTFPIKFRQRSAVPLLSSEFSRNLFGTFPMQFPFLGVVHPIEIWCFFLFFLTFFHFFVRLPRYFSYFCIGLLCRSA